MQRAWNSEEQIIRKKLFSLFHLPLVEAAKAVHKCPSGFKQFCRRYGLKRWPFRKLQFLKKLLRETEQIRHHLQSKGQSSHRRFEECSKAIEYLSRIVVEFNADPNMKLQGEEIRKIKLMIKAHKTALKTHGICGKNVNQADSPGSNDTEKFNWDDGEDSVDSDLEDGIWADKLILFKNATIQLAMEEDREEGVEKEDEEPGASLKRKTETDTLCPADTSKRRRVHHNTKKLSDWKLVSPLNIETAHNTLTLPSFSNLLEKLADPVTV